jgi:hypothetical protein
VTPLAIILAVSLLVPGTFLGGLARIVYLFFVGSRLSAGLLGDIGLIFFPNLLQGSIAGALSLYVTSRVIKKANLEITAYTVSAVVVVLAVIGATIGFAPQGLYSEIAGLIAFTIGVIGGLFITAKSITEERARASSVTR